MKIETRKDKVTGVINIVVGDKLINTGTTDRAEARRLVQIAAQLSSVVAEFNLGQVRKVCDIIEEYAQWLQAVGTPATNENKLYFLKAWARDMAVANLAVTSVTEKHIAGWINAKDGTKLGTRRVRLAVLHKFFEFVAAKRYGVYDPSRLVKIELKKLSHEQKEVEEKQCFTPKEFATVYDHLSAEVVRLQERIAGLPKGHLHLHKHQYALQKAIFWKCAAGIGRYAGLRLGDIAQLEWATMKKPGKFIVWTDKRDKRVELDVTPELAEVLALIPKDHHQYCFPPQRKICGDESKSKRALLSTQFRRMLHTLGIEDKSFHCLRYMYVTECAQKGIPMPHIQQRVGHSSLAQTQLYNKS